MNGHVRIHFPITHDEHGFPPFAVETVWAQPTEMPHEFVLANFPFFACDATVDDRVEATEVNGVRQFVRVVQSSTNSLIRVWLTRTTADTRASRVAECYRRLVALGCICESMKQLPLIAVSIPRNVSADFVQAYLRSSREIGELQFEEVLLRH